MAAGVFGVCRIGDERSPRHGPRVWVGRRVAVSQGAGDRLDRPPEAHLVLQPPRLDERGDNGGVDLCEEPRRGHQLHRLSLEQVAQGAAVHGDRVVGEELGDVGLFLGSIGEGRVELAGLAHLLVVPRVGGTGERVGTIDLDGPDVDDGLDEAEPVQGHARCRRLPDPGSGGLRVRGHGASAPRALRSTIGGQPAHTAVAGVPKVRARAPRCAEATCHCAHHGLLIPSMFAADWCGCPEGQVVRPRPLIGMSERCRATRATTPGTCVPSPPVGRASQAAGYGLSSLVMTAADRVMISFDIGGGLMADVLVRDVPEAVLARVDAHAARLGLSRVEYIRRRLAADASTSAEAVSAADLRVFAEVAGDLADPQVMGAAWH